MVHLRLAREDSREEAPLAFESVALKPVVRWCGWFVSVLLAAGGITVMVASAGTTLELAGALAAACGAVLVAALVRCRRHETTVGGKWFKTRLGPFHNDLPRQLVAGTELRSATGWRRMFADRELVVVLSAGPGGPVLPTLKADEICEALATPSTDE